MAQGYHALTEKEKQTLRLIVRGHDAKSTARHLGLSVHTINERLRDARRKLEVSSSREAARMVFETEGQHPESVGDTQMGEAGAVFTGQDGQDQVDTVSQGRFAWPLAGVAIMSIILGILALASLATDDASSLASSAAPGASPVAASESEAASAARAWLVLGDEARWAEGWRATAASFRRANSVERWAEVAAKVRGPLGAVRSRSLLSQESVPAPPAGVEVVKFRTDFANKAGVLETVSLAREDGTWKVVGIYLE